MISWVLFVDLNLIFPWYRLDILILVLQPSLGTMLCTAPAICFDVTLFYGCILLLLWLEQSREVAVIVLYTCRVLESSNDLSVTSVNVMEGLWQVLGLKVVSVHCHGPGIIEVKDRCCSGRREQLAKMHVDQSGTGKCSWLRKAHLDDMVRAQRCKRS